MFGLRILLLLAAIYLVFAILKRLATGPRRVTVKKPGKVDKMVQCEQCGTYIPENEAVTANGKHYCCAQHQRDAQEKN